MGSQVRNTAALLSLALVVIVSTYASSVPWRHVATDEKLPSARLERGIEGDWPNLLGPGHASVSPETHLRTEWPDSGPVERWRAAIGTGYSSPVVRDGKVVVFHRVQDEEILECFDVATGRSLWKKPHPTTYKCPFEYSNGPYSTPVVDDERVYAWGAQGTLYCHSAATGSLVWQRSIARQYDVQLGPYAVAASPLLDGDRLILNLGAKKRSAGIVALDRETGETLWTATEETASHATPVAATIHGRRFVFVLTELNLVAIDPSDGTVHWKYPFHAKTRDLGKLNATSPLVHKDCVLLSAMQVGTACLRTLPGGGYEEQWRAGPRVLDTQYNNLVAIDDRLFGWSSLNRTLRQLDIASGKVQWKWSGEMGRGAWSIALGDRLLLFGETGRIAALEVGKPDPHLFAISKPLLRGPCYAAPALSRGLLFLRNESTLLCLDLSQRAVDSGVQ